MLKAFLDLVILQMLEQRSMTAYRIDSRVIDRFHSKINISVIYTKLATMERLDLINASPAMEKLTALQKKAKNC